MAKLQKPKNKSTNQKEQSTNKRQSTNQEQHREPEQKQKMEDVKGKHRFTRATQNSRLMETEWTKREEKTRT